jgi:hypothetical protein
METTYSARFTLIQLSNGFDSFNIDTTDLIPALKIQDLQLGWFGPPVALTPIVASRKDKT